MYRVVEGRGAAGHWSVRCIHTHVVAYPVLMDREPIVKFSIEVRRAMPRSSHYDELWVIDKTKPDMTGLVAALNAELVHSPHPIPFAAPHSLYQEGTGALFAHVEWTMESVGALLNEITVNDVAFNSAALSRFCLITLPPHPAFTWIHFYDDLNAAPPSIRQLYQQLKSCIDQMMINLRSAAWRAALRSIIDRARHEVRHVRPARRSLANTALLVSHIIWKSVDLLPTRASNLLDSAQLPRLFKRPPPLATDDELDDILVRFMLSVELIFNGANPAMSGAGLTSASMVRPRDYPFDIITGVMISVADDYGRILAHLAPNAGDVLSGLIAIDIILTHEGMHALCAYLYGNCHTTTESSFISKTPQGDTVTDSAFFGELISVKKFTGLIRSAQTDETGRRLRLGCESIDRAGRHRVIDEWVKSYQENRGSGRKMEPLVMKIFDDDVEALSPGDEWMMMTEQRLHCSRWHPSPPSLF